MPPNAQVSGLQSKIFIGNKEELQWKLYTSMLATE